MLERDDEVLTSSSESSPVLVFVVALHGSIIGRVPYDNGGRGKGVCVCM